MKSLSEYPEENELVIAVVKKLLPYGAFCQLIEYDNKEAFMHISEVAPRWIKNIHEFLSEGQRLVVKVIRVDKERGHIDVSLRRVSEEEKRRKLDLYTKEKRAWKLIEVALKRAKVRNVEKVIGKIYEEYDMLYDFLLDILDEGEKAFEGLDFPQKAIPELIELVKANIKKPKAVVKSEFKLEVHEGNGVEVLKKALKKAKKYGEIKYLGAPRYMALVEEEDYKKANKKMEKMMKEIENMMKGHDAIFEWQMVKK